MKKMGTRFLVGFMMAAMLAVAGRGQAMSFTPNTETQNQFAPTMQNMETQFAQGTQLIKTATTTSAKMMGGVEKKLGTEKTAGGVGEKWKPDVFRLSLLPSLAYFSYEEFMDYGEVQDNMGPVREPINNVRLMDIKGMVYGFESNLKININPSGFGFMLVPFDLAVYNGKGLTYTGADAGERYGDLIAYNQRIFLFWIRGLAGPTITIANHYRFNFLTGYGYKYTEHNSYDIEWAVQRTNKIDYIPLILQFEYMTEHFSVLAHGEYDIFWGGVQTQYEVMLSTQQVSKDWSTHQNKGYGFRTSIELAYYGVTIAPFFNYFWIDKSELGTDKDIPIPASTEPLNITKEYGVKVGYQF